MSHVHILKPLAYALYSIWLFTHRHITAGFQFLAAWTPHAVPFPLCSSTTSLTKVITSALESSRSEDKPTEILLHQISVVVFHCPPEIPAVLIFSCLFIHLLWQGNKKVYVSVLCWSLSDVC